MQKNPIYIFLFLILLIGKMTSVASVEASDLFEMDIREVEEEVIWGLDFLGAQDEILFTTRSGDIYLYSISENKKTKIKHDLKIKVNGQGGLLDLLVDGDDILLTYSLGLNRGEITTALYKGKLNRKENKLVGQDLFVAKTSSSTGYHFGSRVIVYDDSYLMSVGERGVREEAQSLKNHHGKIIRITKEGKPHPANPFKDAPFIYSYGHRNPQGLALDLNNKTIFSTEFGPQGGDELNIIQKGKNYGWPSITYGREYYGPKIGLTHKKGMEQPLHYWVPSISPSGLMIYKGDHFPAWKGDLFLANLSSRHLRRVTLNKDRSKVIDEKEYLKEQKERLRVIKESPQGHIVIGTDSGKIIILSLKKSKNTKSSKSSKDS